jgi:hypothetical protein
MERNRGLSIGMETISTAFVGLLLISGISFGNHLFR